MTTERDPSRHPYSSDLTIEVPSLTGHQLGQEVEHEGQRWLVVKLDRRDNTVGLHELQHALEGIARMA